MALVCAGCGVPIDPTGPAVAAGRRGSSALAGDEPAVWVPFVEDLHGVRARLLHPRCFARTEGFDTLIETITRYERDLRHDLFELMRTNDELRRYCLDLKAGLQRGDLAVPPAFP